MNPSISNITLVQRLLDIHDQNSNQSPSDSDCPDTLLIPAFRKIQIPFRILQIPAFRKIQILFRILHITAFRIPPFRVLQFRNLQIPFRSAKYRRPFKIGMVALHVCLRPHLLVDMTSQSQVNDVTIGRNGYHHRCLWLSTFGRSVRTFGK